MSKLDAPIRSKFGLIHESPNSSYIRIKNSKTPFADEIPPAG